MVWNGVWSGSCSDRDCLNPDVGCDLQIWTNAWILPLSSRDEREARFNQRSGQVHLPKRLMEVLRGFFRQVCIDVISRSTPQLLCERACVQELYRCVIRRLADSVVHL